ncbi:unnamed protein product [Vicia faba]|uniref:Uncharacterized protein n=1 Tax=Vicia faba TaxID=3906 RepID=A0AAV0ZUV2_VICFA|nr:unnamed protein product [Vicia faba]
MDTCGKTVSIHTCLFKLPCSANHPHRNPLSVSTPPSIFAKWLGIQLLHHHHTINATHNHRPFFQLSCKEHNLPLCNASNIKLPSNQFTYHHHRPLHLYHSRSTLLSVTIQTQNKLVKTRSEPEAIKFSYPFKIEKKTTNKRTKSEPAAMEEWSAICGWCGRNHLRGAHRWCAAASSRRLHGGRLMV